jgi:integrase
LVEASGVLRHLRSCFRWAVDQDLIERDPTQGVRDPAGSKRERERKRVLSDKEIVALWQVCDEIGFPFGPIVKLLLLTGQREMEVGELPWSELDTENRTWALPGERTKNRQPHEIHLSALARAVIAGIPRFADNKDLVFSLNGTKAVQSYSDAKARIDKRMAEILGEVEPWVLHDLRRTITTGMARLKVPPHIADKVLNHRSGTITGVAAVYNQFEYLDERVDALDAWGEFVARLVHPGRNVVPLRAPQMA